MLPDSIERTDAEIAVQPRTHWNWTVSVPADRIQVIVEHGWLTLQGEVDSEYQRSYAEAAVRGLIGLKGILNDIAVKPLETPTEIQTRDRGCFQAQCDAGCKPHPSARSIREL